VRPSCRGQPTVLAAHRHHPAGQRRLTNEAARPQLLEQFFFADQAVAVLDHIGQEIEYLRLDLDRPPAGAQLIALQVEFTDSSSF
jgi:hypothetical protein